MLSAEQEPAELGTGLKVDPLSFPTSLSPTSLAGGGRVPVSPVFPFILGVPAGRAEPLLERWSAMFALKHWGKPTSLRNKVCFGSSPLLFLHKTQLRVTPQWHLGALLSGCLWAHISPDSDLGRFCPSSHQPEPSEGWDRGAGPQPGPSSEAMICLREVMALLQQRQHSYTFW